MTCSFTAARLAAKAEFLPLDEMNWIVCDNVPLPLRLASKVCPPEGTSVKLHSDDLFQTPLEQPEIEFENEGGETYICCNPPYVGSKKQTVAQKDDMETVVRTNESLRVGAPSTMSAGSWLQGFCRAADDEGRCLRVCLQRTPYRKE